MRAIRLASAVLAAAAALLVFPATAPRTMQHARRAAGKIAMAPWPYLPGSIVPVRVDGFPVPYHVALVGPGSLLADGRYVVPVDAPPGAATLIAGNAVGLAERSVQIGSIPSFEHDTLAVASYDDGIVLHDAATFSVLGLLATGGTPSDVAGDGAGRIAVTDTQGLAITLVGEAPWNVTHVQGVPFGDEVAFDRSTGAIFVTNRDVRGAGALTRVDAGGHIAQVATGLTAEGLAIDERRQIVYVANVNDDTVTAVDARSMRILRTFHVAARVFSLALSGDGTKLYAISNQSEGSPFAAAGSAVLVDLRPKKPRVIARSRDLTFPIGVALDASTQRLFVTDESLDVVYVLDARTLAERHAPLPTCRTPWKPSLDPKSGRLYVPCARADEIDVFDARTLRRVAGAPFKTGGYPLAVTVWHAPGSPNRSHR